MKTFYLDTSVLLPGFVSAHSNHERCLSLFNEVIGRGKVITSTHTYAELFSNLTRLPHGLHISPDRVYIALTEKLSPQLVSVSLDWVDYLDALKRCAQARLTSGVIYDALHVQAAKKSNADILYTANIRDFSRLMTPDISFELRDAHNT